MVSKKIARVKRLYSEELDCLSKNQVKLDDCISSVINNNYWYSGCIRYHSKLARYIRELDKFTRGRVFAKDPSEGNAKLRKKITSSLNTLLGELKSIEVHLLRLPEYATQVKRSDTFWLTAKTGSCAVVLYSVCFNDFIGYFLLSCIY